VSAFASQQARDERRERNRRVTPRMPASLEGLLRSVNRMTWSPLLGAKGYPPRARVFRMGCYQGHPQHESAEIVRWPDGSWSWSAWVKIPEALFQAVVGGKEPNRKHAERAAEKAFRKLCEAGYRHSVNVAKLMLQAGGRVH
jgi:hypothetical protein